MSCGWNPCYASCPPTTVTIQPPPFVLSIPGPSIFCPDQPVCIEQRNPCVPVLCLEENSHRRQRSLSACASPDANSSGLQSQHTQQRSRSGGNPCQRC